MRNADWKVDCRKENRECPAIRLYSLLCSVCRAAYGGAFEELPEDDTCPVCKQPKRVFVKKQSEEAE